MKSNKTMHMAWFKGLLCFLLTFAMIFSNVTIVKAETDSEMNTFPSVTEYTASEGEFSLKSSSRFVVVSNSLTLENKILENDLKLLSSEFHAAGLTEESMNILYGSESTAAAGDIVIRMNPASDVSPEAYEIKITDKAEVSATGEAGIFYGIRTIQKTLLLNDGKMDCGTITDAPSVDVRGMHLDTARKMYTKDWVMALIKDLSYLNINTLQFHFSENEGYRLESSLLEELDGWSYPSDGYFTKEDMLDIIAECQKYHIELVPSLDSPGHMTYVLNYLPDDWDCTSIWSASSDFRSPQTFNIFEKEECRQFLKDLFTEYAEFFSEAGCKHMNIGGDEFLNNFGNMTNDQYVTVMNYFNDISAIVKSYGMIPRAWNDGLLYTGYTGYTLDPDIEICYWSGPAQCATIEEFVENGNKIINMADVYMYYVLAPWWDQYANPIGSKIFNEWTPGKLANSSRIGDQSIDYPYEDWLSGASFAIWSDNPGYRTQEQVATNIFMRSRAMAERAWNPNSAYTYTELETLCNELGHAPGYDGTALPDPGEVLYDGTFGTLTLRYVDTDGNPLKEDFSTHGLKDEAYTITPDEIYGYRFVSMDKDTEGVYTTDEILVTLTYELYTDKTELDAAVNADINEDDYIPATYTAYKAALENAKTVLKDDKAVQTAVDEALEALNTAKAALISLDRTELYLEVEYPLASAGYTAASYTDYQNALNAGKTVLLNPDASAEQVETALNNINTAKNGLALSTSDDFITVTSTQVPYWVGTYPLSYSIDGNLSTFTWLSGGQNLNDVLAYEFASPVVLNSVRYQAPEGAGGDIFKDAVVEISNDGSSWEEIGTLKEETDKTIDAGGATVSHVRIRVVGETTSWTKIAEVTFSYTEETVDKTTLENAVASAKELIEEDYTSASWTVLEAAIAKAEAVCNDDGASDAEITAAINALKASVEALAEPEEEEEEEKPEVCEVFTDVPHGAWYESYVQYVYDNGLMAGSNGLFNPTKNVTRAQLVTTLYRMAGEPEVTDRTALTDFTDVADGLYYTDAVCWAYHIGVGTGNDGKFNPTGSLTRQQMAAFLYRYADIMEYDTTQSADYSDMLNADQVSGYAKEAVSWAVGAGLISGSEVTNTDGTVSYDLKPRGNTTRAQLAAILQRFCE